MGERTGRGAARAGVVRDVMVTPVATTTPDTPVGIVRRRLEQSALRHLAVLERGLLVGIVSYWDVLRADSDALPVRDLMTRTVFVVAPETSLAAAARVFRERRLPVLPVVQGRALVGMLSAVDVLGPARPTAA